MMHKASEISRYDFRSADKFLIDTNVWMFLYGPQKPGGRKTAAYSQALARILDARSKIYIDVLIVSEFINRYARLKWNMLPLQPANFKEFRKSDAFRPVAEDIAADVKLLLRHCDPIESGFESLSIGPLLDVYAAGDSDFNDQVLMALCREQGLTLITDDADFKDCGIPVITANKRLLN